MDSEGGSNVSTHPIKKENYMKIMTLNTHSWLEEEPREKLKQIAQKICHEQYDVIALQEVNQTMDAKRLTSEQLKNFNQVQEQTPVRSDNFAYCLIQLLAEQGETYYWSWEMSHIGYAIYEEGNALLSKQPLISQTHLVSETKEKEDYHTRKILVGQTSVKTQFITVASCHFSWWADEKSGFAFEWKELEASLAPLSTPLYLLGDFNNPAESSGYDLVAKSQLPIHDAYPIAQKKQAEATIEKRIDGWENNKEGLRIDYIYVPQDCFVTSYQRIFDGENGPIVSDHYGVAVTLE